jgi:hypothetical protein
MPKLRVELDGSNLTECAILKDGQPQTQVIRLGVHLDANTRSQLVDLGTVAVIDGDTFESSQVHTIKRATLSIEYEEA